MEKAIRQEKLSLGVCYYPEHWSRELWESDLERMKAAGIETVRVAEFSWNLTEPEDGVFVYDFWDSFLDLALRMGMKVIFCTPTATPPAWLTQKHPEVLNCDKNGLPYHHGSRRHYNYNSRVYQEYVKRIVTVLAKHYGSHPAIVGWQIDNELNCEVNTFYSQADDEAFRVFARKTYGTLDALNEEWGTVFWNQTYTDWNQVHIPWRPVDDAVNPHLQLDYVRFISDSACRFAALQSDILKQYIRPGVFITTNGIFGNLDNHRMTQESLDFMMYDSYPNFAFDLYSDPNRPGTLNDRKWSRNLTEVRSISPQFGIMEQQSGANGWNCSMEAPSPKPGQLRLWTMQSVAHGADYVSYFRWRTSTRGTEIYWHGILDYDNRDNRKLKEVCQVRDWFEAVKETAGSRFAASFAVLKDYDNVWDAELDRWHGRLEKESTAGIFAGAQKTHTPMDYCYLTPQTTLGDLQKYPVLFYPHPAIVRPETAALLEQYVRAGGTLVLGCRAGYKDAHGQCVMSPAPGLLAPLAGYDVTDFTFIGPADIANAILPEKDAEQKSAFAGTIETAVFCDIMQAHRGTKVLGRYRTDYYKKKPALLYHPFGAGGCYTLGTTFTQKNTEQLLKLLGIAEPHAAVVSLPESCELTVREAEHARYYFVLNYQNRPARITVHEPMQELLRGKKVSGQVSVPAYGAAVLFQSTVGIFTESDISKVVRL